MSKGVIETTTVKAKNKRLLLLLVGIVLGMFAFGYALVPLYNTMCSVFGINGKTGGAVAYNAKSHVIDKNRYITVEFIVTNNGDLPWKFYPRERKIRLHPGELRRTSFFAENETGRTMTIQAIPSVTPSLAAKYLKKTECFCFTQQTLKGHESMDMPLLFHMDPDLPKNIHTLTLSYTIFDLSKLRAAARQADADL